MESYRNLYEIIRRAKSENLFNDIPIFQIISLGVQSAGKSSLLERIIGYPLLPKGDHLCTKCPIEIALGKPDYNDNLNTESVEDYGIFYGKQNHLSMDELSTELKKLNKARKISSDPIKLCVYGETKPSFIMVDLPGIAVNNSSNKLIISTIEKYATMSNSIILTVSSITEDLVTSEAIRKAKKYDPQGNRTIHVLTKIDSISPKDLNQELKEEFLKPSLGVFLTANKQNDDEFEQNTLDNLNLDTDSSNHGIQALVSSLEKIFMEKLKFHLPANKKILKQKIEKIKEELETLKKNNPSQIVNSYINLFRKNFVKILEGKEDYDNDKLYGGARIADRIYFQFMQEINKLSIGDYKDNDLLIEWKNAGGSKGFKKDVDLLAKRVLKKEISKFESIVDCCLKDTRELLIELVDESLQKIQDIQELAKIRIKEEMMIYIENRNKDTKKEFESILRSEKNEVKINMDNFIKKEETLDNGLWSIIIINLFSYFSSGTKELEAAPKIEKDELKSCEADLERTRNICKIYFNLTKGNLVNIIPKQIHCSMVESVKQDSDNLYSLILEASEMLDLQDYKKKIDDLENKLKRYNEIMEELDQYR